MTAPSLVEELLADQQSLSAVEQFSRAHDAHALAPGNRYRNLIPLEAPRTGEQYAFEVELDKCSGCKACVTACHSLNGLDENETWREVGLLISPPFKPWKKEPAVQQTVTTACHHCVDPACLNGCPVLAYEKDSVTGIVRHLDDQCIGCQYCVLKCPYDVPKYNARLGIVRKCDMCANRLAVGEAPACVQACPNEAIRITKVETSSVTIEFRERKQPFLSGAPAGDYTLPTTRFSGANGIGRGVLATPLQGSKTCDERSSTKLRRAKDSAPHLMAADALALRPQPAHWPLVLMLVLSQAAVGVCGAAALWKGSRALLLAALMLGIASIVASVFHLGRPLGAWRFFLGLKRSWLSREILAFGIFVPMLGLVLSSAQPAARRDMPSPLNGVSDGATQTHSFPPERIRVLPPRSFPVGGSRKRSMEVGAVTAAGLIGVFCSMMIYHDTRRALWHWRRSAPLFFGTAAVFGAAAAFALNCHNNIALAAFVTTLALKLLIEILVVRHVADRELTSLKKTALLVTGKFQYAAFARVVCAVGAVGIALLLNTGALSPTLALLPFLLASVGELIERLLFFRTVDAPKMPGGLVA